MHGVSRRKPNHEPHEPTRTEEENPRKPRSSTEEFYLEPARAIGKKLPGTDTLPGSRRFLYLKENLAPIKALFPSDVIETTSGSGFLNIA